MNIKIYFWKVFIYLFIYFFFIFISSNILIHWIKNWTKKNIIKEIILGRRELFTFNYLLLSSCFSNFRKEKKTFFVWDMENLFIIYMCVIALFFFFLFFNWFLKKEKGKVLEYLLGFFFFFLHINSFFLLIFTENSYHPESIYIYMKRRNTHWISVKSV